MQGWAACTINWYPIRPYFPYTGQTSHCPIRLMTNTTQGDDKHELCKLLVWLGPCSTPWLHFHTWSQSAILPILAFFQVNYLYQQSAVLSCIVCWWRTWGSGNLLLCGQCWLVPLPRMSIHPLTQGVWPTYESVVEGLWDQVMCNYVSNAE